MKRNSASLREHPDEVTSKMFVSRQQKEHQLWQCQKLYLDHFLHPETQTSPKSTTTSYDEEDDCVQDVLSKLFPEELSEIRINHHSWVKVQSSKYRKGVFVLLTYDLIDPVFGKVGDLLVVNDTIILLLTKHKSIFFDVHCNAFKVQPLSTHVAIEQHTLDFFNVLHHQQTFILSDTSIYLTLPYIM